jgi:hypothetical protein
MRPSSFLLVLALAALAPPAHADVSVGAKPPTAATTANGAARVVATLERTACFGTCPMYRLTIYADGRVDWDGRGFVKVKGKAGAHLTPAALAELRRAFAAAGYFELRGPFDCYEVTDNPSANLSYDDGRRTRTIQHYYGCSTKGVAALTTLEDRIDEIVGSVRWVGTRKERERLRNQASFRP